jgi:hypothetical protein
MGAASSISSAAVDPFSVGICLPTIFFLSQNLWAVRLA